ncbi:uncharacterized protein [Diadema antillarum]|uniref:uncharacterized protein n=1 Tax=Diadema antillarum TaxID=105358 RepID=UPI003A897867
MVLEDHGKEISESLQEIRDSFNYQSQETEVLKEKVAGMQKEFKEKDRIIHEEIDRPATYVARENLVFLGIPRTSEVENVDERLHEFYVQKLKIPPDVARGTEHQRAHRVPAAKQLNPIKARYVKFADKVLIQKHARNLKGNGDKMFITDDLPKRVREERQSQIPALKAARSAGKLAYFSRSEPTKLYVDRVLPRKEHQESFIMEITGEPRARQRDRDERKSPPESRELHSPAMRTPPRGGNNSNSPRMMDMETTATVQEVS